MSSIAGPESGIDGIVTRSPAQGGPMRQGSDDSAPMANAELNIQVEGRSVAQVTTDGEGKFRVNLPPGHYTISLKGQKRGIGGCTPSTVDVATGETNKVELTCDVGLR